MKHFLEQLQAVLGLTFSTLGAFIAPIAGTLLAVGMVIFLDTVVAFWRTRVKKETWTSRKMGNGLVFKFISYQTAVLLFFIIDKFILNDFVLFFFNMPFFLTKVMALAIILIEFKSIDESWRMIKGIGLLESVKNLLKIAKYFKKGIEDLNEGKTSLEKPKELKGESIEPSNETNI